MQKPTCSASNCERDTLARGMCSMHYAQAKRSGTLPPKATPEQRFFAKVAKSAECWEWTATKDRDGYGQFRHEGRMRQAHCVAYEITNGAIPEGMEIDHRCLNRGCVNPAHLRTATRKQNRENLAGAYANNEHGVRGVSWHKRAQKWSVRVSHDGQVSYLGLFESKAEAEAAAVEGRKSLFTHNEVDRA